MSDDEIYALLKGAITGMSIGLLGMICIVMALILN